MKRLPKMPLIVTCFGVLIPVVVPAGTLPLAPRALVSLEFVDEHGRAFETYRAASRRADTFRAYLEATPKARYTIRARNLTGQRVGIVIAVDGRNIISGERSELESDESMYVLDPYQSASYAGWRTSAEAVRRFYFTDAEDSYAGRIGDESAIGIIAVAVYEAVPEPRPAWRQRGAQAPAAAAAETEPRSRADVASEPSMQAGTGFGERQRSRAVRVAFTPARWASQRSFYKYEWTDQLCARGVKACETDNRFWPEMWEGFVPLPPGERG